MLQLLKERRISVKPKRRASFVLSRVSGLRVLLVTALVVVVGCSGKLNSLGVDSSLDSDTSGAIDDGIDSEGLDLNPQTADPVDNEFSALLFDVLPEVVPETVAETLPRRRGSDELRYRFEDVLGIQSSAQLPVDKFSLDGFPFNRGHELSGGDLSLLVDAVIEIGESVALQCSDCLDEFIEEDAGRLLGRPISIDLRAELARTPSEASLEDFGFARAVSVIGVSEPTLYATEPLSEIDTRGFGVIDSYAVADRLATWLWSSAPDDRLLALAATQALQRPGVRAAEALRMLADTRAGRFVEGFFLKWLHVTELPDMSKNSGLFPNFDRGRAELLLDDLRRHLVEWLTSNGTLEDLLSRPIRLGREVPPEYFTGDDRLGVLHHPAWLAANAGPVEASSVHRGLFVQRALGCNEIPFPSSAALAVEFDAFPDDLDRKGIADLHASTPACATCHDYFEPIGFAFDRFGATGLYRERDERGNPLDTVASLVGLGPVTQAEVQHSRELVEQLASSKRVWACFAQTLSQYALQRPVVWDDGWLLKDVTEAFFAAGSKIHGLVAAIAEHPAFVRRTVTTDDREVCSP